VRLRPVFLPVRVAIDGVDLVCDRYCKRVYDSDPTMRSTIFHTLLRIYLRPRADHPVLFAPALSLLSTHAARIDAIEAFELLPPLVALEDIQVYLTKTLRRSVEKRREAKMVRGVGKSAVDQAEGEVVDLEERRVKITEGRLCVSILFRSLSFLRARSVSREVTELGAPAFVVLAVARFATNGSGPA
jgi:hypothetical protein